MSLSGLLDLAAGDPELAEAVKRVPAPRHLDLVAPPALRPFVAAVLATRTPAVDGSAPGADGSAGTPPLLAVTATAREAEDLAAALSSLVDAGQVALFPAWETLPHERLSPRSDTVGQRLAVLRRLDHPGPAGDAVSGRLRVVVTPIRAILQPIVAGLGDAEPVQLRPGDEADLGDVVTRLVDAGYHRVDLVEKRGELAVRGGILDVFPPTEEHPLRVEFWGDTVEEVRYFKAADQRSLESGAGVGSDRPAGVATELWAPPCRELLLTPEVRERAKRLAAEHPSLAEVLDTMADGSAVEGMEAFAPVLADRMELLLDHFPSGARVVVCDPERIRGRAVDLVRTSQEFLEASWVNAAAGGEAPIDLGAATYKSIEEIRAHASRRGLAWWTIGPFGGAATEPAGDPGDPKVAGGGAARPTRRVYSDSTGELVEAEPGAEPPDLADGADGATGPAADAVALAARTADSYRGDTARVVADIAGWVRDGWRVVLVTEGHGPAERLVEVLRGEDLPARLETGLATPPEPSIVHVSTGRLEHGFVWDAVRLVVLTETDLTGQRSSTKDMRRLPSRRRGTVDPLRLAPGDYVVHEQHGVGRYVELVSRTIQGATREYLVIEYARGDRLFVPTDQLEEITRYVGGEAPTLHRLGGSDWQKAKGRARRAVRQIAGELIRLYSARMASPGIAFGADSPWQRELEDAFPYTETPDQLAAIEEVKADMHKPVPMDRLVCGDVGYGKTEIAVRAAFKAVQDGRQVAVLVPTTLLVQQHLSTFAERYGSFPVVVKPLSRFQSDREVAETRRGIADGTVDVVIGTHRLLSPETRFKRLGLAVIDEEQRFGVEHKEFLKQMRTQVDVLSMSATPIPRTLEMGLSGIREMSTILTPPEERHPILTFVGPYDEKQIAAAIRRELFREGQVFFVHNRVRSIDRVAARINALVPEARVAVAHGQMNEHQLERIMVDFWEKNFDVLVSTTIVESGLDVPNANTLIVDRADMYGLSQLHQLRGRVGRGRERGYAYFLYPAEAPLSETAHERLATVAQHTEMGAGMYVAMKDLEIRGAGNVLGAEQSGHIAGVGFDLYVRMIGEAVRELRAESDGAAPAEEAREVKVDLPVDAHIPHEYVPGERLRLEAYRRIAAISSDEEVAAAGAELADRYGPLPEVVHNLLEVARFRARARHAGLTDVTLRGNHIQFAPAQLPDSRQIRLNRLYPKSILKPQVRTLLVPVPRRSAGSGTSTLGARPLRDQELLVWCAELVDTIFDAREPGPSGGAGAGAPGRRAGGAG